MFHTFVETRTPNQLIAITKHCYTSSAVVDLKGNLIVLNFPSHKAFVVCSSVPLTVKPIYSSKKYYNGAF